MFDSGGSIDDRSMFDRFSIDFRGLEEDWRRLGRGVGKDWRTGGGLEEDWRMVGGALGHFGVTLELLWRGPGH